MMEAFMKIKSKQNNNAYTYFNYVYFFDARENEIMFSMTKICKIIQVGIE